MATIRDRIEQDIKIDEPTTLFGLVVGTVTVRKGGNLQVHGMINGRVLLESGSEVYIHGMINGDVINEGGNLVVFGAINGKLHKVAGTTTIDSRATIRDGS
jgi:hypothetical protein